MKRDEQRAVDLTELFQGEVLAVIQRDEFKAMPNLVVHGLAEVLGTMLANGVRQEPEATPLVLYMIEQLRARIETASGSMEPPVRPH